MLEVSNINFTQKNRKGEFSIKDVNFTLEDGMFMCLLGKNGAGKTTLLNLIYGISKLYSGWIRWNGKRVDIQNIHEFHSDVAYVGNEEWCFSWMTMSDNLEILSCLYENFDRQLYLKLLESFDLNEEDVNKRYLLLSSGQKVKFQLAFAMARRPKLLLLDEPFANLDPVIKTDLMDILQKSVRNDDMSLIISTHLIDDIADISDYIGILVDGEMKLFSDRESVMEEYKNMDLKTLMIEIGGNSTWT